MRLESDESGRNRENMAASLRRKTRIARLANPQERERIWSREQLPSYEGVAICSLPKSREFWREVDVLTWCKTELDAACMLLDLPTGGKKLELIARIQDWVHEPEILARQEEQRLLELQQDAILASGRVFAFGCNSNGELGLGHRRSCEVPTEIESFRGAHVTHVYSGFDSNFAYARTEDGQQDESFPVKAPRKVFGTNSVGGFVFAFGSGLQGQLGLGKQKIAAIPSK
ncbi:hypothetical protein BBO99_00008546 [Phytophthora kernoviae]|uniref:SAP domain-containing protein n=2 Tax=Phytophthora kernoviae TaxID=325452 RepID=A0A3R7J3A1_9STRA|nr:hypothetical protein G195_010122 [Phytophthora kernoviae 00238/432]KAG2510696.1 hypothetical protein JM16_008465 [Phytophthora kernoviae]KAG2513467.1 hypothetical protein JM18_008231 [Phytophthora kernoviae]RLM95706.1 hypothetical protein BBI17_008487 [Phytophthora kernoviae]RLN75103.1 hypothetical protein BBO99_00008546 [Phytophthora kernoviae]